MKTFPVLLIMIFFLGCSKVSSKKEKLGTTFYVGTYTKKESKGIYKYELSKEGFLKEIGLVAKTENPSFLAKSKDNKVLLSVDETDKDGTGFVKSFEILKDSLSLLSVSKSGGAHPCFITINDKNQVLVANYTGGNVGNLTLNNKGVLSSLLNVQQHIGKGTTNRQKAPHAHSAWFHPNKKEIISVDLGTNQLWFSKIEEEKNELIFTNQKTLDMAEGSGPRHLTFHPNNKWIYVLNELNNTVSLIKEKEGVYYVASSISTLPKRFTNYSNAADIHISKDGKFLYASNRGHESIVIYEVNLENGNLKTIDYESVFGKSPRNFSLSPDEKFLLVANQDTDNIVVFKRNSETGKLNFVSETSVSMPVCILF
ncbi:lactonase family protein [Polaribacter sp. Z022]|uniref:lactonase family protein n=1 Tax=Polaribacter sp. Z022 TaxID=2927125 RepID=UPI0020209FFE|nr:lactonase family protein [Polaribacter sp. Z022]MCL7754686.1 lactonase family protein [Polaribacter sp. Z022]